MLSNSPSVFNRNLRAWAATATPQLLLFVRQQLAECGFVPCLTLLVPRPVVDHFGGPGLTHHIAGVGLDRFCD